MLVLSDDEREWINKYHFQVTTNAFGSYILIDPELPRKKGRFEGGNLHNLMFLALQERKRHNHNDERPTVSAKVISMVKHTKKIKHGKIFEMKKMVLEDKTISPQEMLNRLQAMGLSSTLVVATTVRNDFIATLNVLKELNVLEC